VNFPPLPTAGRHSAGLSEHLPVKEQGQGQKWLWFIEVKPVLSSCERYWEIFSVPFLLAFDLNVTLSNSGI
jgi:hypothetical protein